MIFSFLLIYFAMRETDKIILLKVWGFLKKWNSWETFSSSKKETSKFYSWDPSNSEPPEWRADFSDSLGHKKPWETSGPPCRPMSPPSKPPRTIRAMLYLKFPHCPKARPPTLRSRPQICIFFNECTCLTSTEPPSQSRWLRLETKLNRNRDRFAVAK